MASDRSSRKRAGAGIGVAALILGTAVLGGSYLISSSLEDAAQELEGIQVAMAQLSGVMRPPLHVRDARRAIRTAGAPVRGAETAPLTLVEIADFQSPESRKLGPTLERILQEYPGEVRIAFKHLPSETHPKAPAAHAAAEAAHRQGKFFEMYERIYGNPQEMSPARYEAYAAEIGLDLERFKRDVASDAVKRRIEADQEELVALGITYAPAFLIDGHYLSGLQSFEKFKALIDRKLARIRF